MCDLPSPRTADRTHPDKGCAPREAASEATCASREADLEMALRDGLRRLPAPQISADFDARVLAALALPPSPWEQVRMFAVSTLRPLLCGAACSLAVTLLALFWLLHAPAGPSSFPAAPVSAARLLDMATVDDLLKRPRLGAWSLSGWARQSASLPIPGFAVPPAPAVGEHRPRAGRRRASRVSPVLLTV